MIKWLCKFTYIKLGGGKPWAAQTRLISDFSDWVEVDILSSLGNLGAELPTLSVKFYTLNSQ